MKTLLSARHHRVVTLAASLTLALGLSSGADMFHPLTFSQAFAGNSHAGGTGNGNGGGNGNGNGNGNASAGAAPNHGAVASALGALNAAHASATALANASPNSRVGKIAAYQSTAAAAALAATNAATADSIAAAAAALVTAAQAQLGLDQTALADATLINDPAAIAAANAAIVADQANMDNAAINATSTAAAAGIAGAASVSISAGPPSFGIRTPASASSSLDTSQEPVGRTAGGLFLRFQLCLSGHCGVGIVGEPGRAWGVSEDGLTPGCQNDCRNGRGDSEKVGRNSRRLSEVYCGPVLRHSAGPIQAANFRSAVAF